MPVLSLFYGVIIRMYAEKGGQHHKPHIHAEYQGEEVVVGLDGEVMTGKIKPDRLQMVQVWIGIHRDDLEANWKLLQNGEASFRIDPLR